MSLFHALKVSQIKRDTAHATVIDFLIPEPLKNNYSFKQGQYLTLRLKINGKEERRSYSILNAPYEKGDTLSILVKQIDKGIVSTFLNTELKTGAMVDIMSPMGSFYPSFSAVKDYYFFAAGSGISPILSNMKEILYTTDAPLHLFYGNKNEESILQKETIENLKNLFPHRLKVNYFFSKQKTQNPSQEGRIDIEKLKFIFKEYALSLKESCFFICGPTAMIKTFSSFLKEEKHIDEEKILYEFFVNESNTAVDISAIQSEYNVTIISAGVEDTFSISENQESILENILNHNVEVPFACKSGICASCKVKLIEGEVHTENLDSLSSKEIKQGFILLCQSFAKSGKVVVSYDF